jgi:hypothetical protein
MPAEATDGRDDAVAVAGFEKAGGRFLRGSAMIDGSGRTRVGDEVVSARRGVVVATGSVPVRPPIPGARRSRVLDQRGGDRRNRRARVAGNTRRRRDRAGGGSGLRRFGTEVTGSREPTGYCRWSARGLAGQTSAAEDKSPCTPPTSGRSRSQRHGPHDAGRRPDGVRR